MKTGFKLHVLSILLILTYESYGQCGAVTISSDDTIICVPQVVKFKANNFPAGTTFEWNVGGGYISSDSTFSNLFNTAGDYSISLRLTYTDNSKCTITKTNFIKAKGKPLITITPSLSVICNFNDSIVLTDNTKGSVSRDWLLNNTLYKNGPKKIKVLYAYPSGYKNLTVFLKDSFGCSAKRTIDSIVYVADSVKLNFSADKLSGCIPQLVNFTNISDTVSNRIASWKWSFQKGLPLTSTIFEPKNVKFSTSDTFDVSLKVTTQKGCFYFIRKNNYLQFGDSISLAASFSKTALCGSEVLKFTFLNARSKAPVLSISPIDYTILADSGKTKFITFAALGPHTFNISDAVYGCKSVRSYKNYVTVNGPLASFNFPFRRGCVTPDTFTGTSTSVVNNGVSVTLKWDLYFDSLPANSLQTGTTNPFKAITKYSAGYTVRLITTGSNGCIDTSKQVSAIIVDKIRPEFKWKPIPACPGEMVFFTNNTLRGSSKVRNFYKWTFFNLNNSIMSRDTNPNPSISYPDTGSYSIKLMAFNILGCKDSITLKRKVIIQRPSPQIIFKDTSICSKGSTKLKVIYKDTSYYRQYGHVWLFQHTDTPAYIARITGDSVVVTGLLPGKYNISYITFSRQSGKCYDTFKLKKKLYVSGDYYKTYASTYKGCNPFIPVITAQKLWSYNFRNNNPNTSLFNWFTFSDTNFLQIAKRTSLVSNVMIKRAGTFYFSYSYHNSSGCSDTIGTFSIASGVKASFNAPQYGCVGKPVKLLNISDPDAVKFKWFVLDSVNSYKFSAKDTSKNLDITFLKDGFFTVGLITFGKGQCTDTGYNSILVNNIKAQFSSADTLNYCAPIIASVSALKHSYIYKYQWFFSQGDTITENLSDISTLFSENTGPGGADVRLIVDAYGCSDTLEKKGYIKVIGPVPNFTMQNNSGCEKLAVKFNNQSKYYKRFYLEYGDGTFLDSVNFNLHSYQIFDRSLSQQVFKPRLFVIDSLGCLAVFKPKDSIIVLRAPNANYTINNDTGCADLLITFRNISQGAISYKWDFDGDGTFDNFTPSPQRSYAPGDYKPVMIAKGLNGCEDKIENKYFIKSYAPPVVTFVASQDTVCYNSSISFTANNFPSNGVIKKWLWDFGNPNTYKDSSSKQNPTYKFNNAYLNQVVLFVTDIHNCTDTFDRFIYVNDTLGLVSPPINFVTVQNNDVFISWAKSGSKRFSRYDLYGDNSGYSFIDSFPAIKDTTKLVTGVNVNARAYCYSISTLDKCRVKGPYAPSHCTILLTIYDSINKLVLNWVPYSGWIKGVERYQIFRSENGGLYRLYDSTTSTTYIDDNLCNKTYCYYIVAIQKNGRWRSQSNTTCKMPIFIKPTATVIPVVTTVLSEQVTYTRWLPYNFVRKVKTYHIARSYKGSSGVNNYAATDSAGFVDKGIDVNTNANSYTYTISVEDHCGNLSPESSVSKTILLTGASVNYVAKMNWTPYEKWFSGVKQYEIFIREDNNFKFLANVSGGQNAFDYNYVDTKLDDSICFKVRAVKDSIDGVISISNTVCLISDPQMWVPNAFTPNKDGHNEVFIPKAILIFNKTGNPILDYHMEIYNRWGQKVFESFDVNSGWDGTYDGKQCQEGNYMYKIKGLGLDGTKNFNLEGVISLLR